MSETIKSLATLLQAVRGLNEDKRDMEKYAARKLIDMKLEEEYAIEKENRKKLNEAVNTYTKAESALLSGQLQGEKEDLGDFEKDERKNLRRAVMFSTAFGFSGNTPINKKMFTRRLGNSQVADIGAQLTNFGEVFTEQESARKRGIDVPKNPAIVKQLTFYKDALDAIDVNTLSRGYRQDYETAQSLLSTYLGE
jgi:hypothetical protein